MGLCRSYTWCLVLLIICSAFTAAQADPLLVPNVSRSLQQQQDTNCQPQQSTQYYSIPPFAVQFTTLDVNEIPAVSNVVISETDAKASSLTYPLKIATQEFLMSKFREHIMDLSQATKQDQMYHDYYQQLTEVELRVVLKHNPKVTDIPGHVALIATLHGTLHFVHASGCGGTTLVPTQDEITVTFGAWLESILERNRDEYLQRLLGSSQEMLQEIVELGLVPNYFQDQNGGESSSWLMMLWVVIGIVGLCGLGAALVSMMRGQRSLKNYAFDPNSATFMDDDDQDNTLRLSTQLDSKQHGMDDSAHRRHSLDILNKSEEYLSKHRPDLTEGGGQQHKQSSFMIKPFENIMSLFDLSSGSHHHHHYNSENNSPEKTPRGRRSFATRARSSIELQAGNIAANSEEPSPFDDISLNHEASPGGGQSHEEAIMMAAAAQGSAYRPISSIWRSMTSVFHGSSYHNENDGIMNNANFYYDGNEEEYFAKLEEDRLRDEQWMTFMKEEEQDYNFAFKDFPRKDGTPCLIYNGSTEANDIFTAPKSPKEVSKDVAADAAGESDILNEREILSDEAFRQLLNMNASPSFEDTIEPLPTVGCKSPEFNERLSSLFAEKHRQYEKRSIVERHQQKRKKEREMERRERQKDMHRELEALEAGMAMSDKWRAKNHVSPRPYDLSPARPSYSPNIHSMRRSPAMRSSPAPGGSRRSPGPFPGARRSPVPPIPFTSSIPPRHVASKSVDALDTDYSIQLIRPRMTRPPAAAAPPSDLFLMDSSSSSRYHHHSSTDFDLSSLDKLSMPTMGNKTSKHPSPSLVVLDDPSSQQQFPPSNTSGGNKIPPRNPALHRRHNSTENLHYTGHRSRDLETIASMTPPRRGLSPARRVASPRFGTRGISPIRHSTGARGISPARSVTRGMSPARSVTRGMSPARSVNRGMSPARTSTTTTTRGMSPARGRRPARGLSPKPGPRSTSNSSRQSRDGVFDHGIAALI